MFLEVHKTADNNKTN